RRREVERRVVSESIVGRSIRERVGERFVGIGLVQPAIAEDEIVLRHRKVVAEEIAAIAVEVEKVRARAVRADRRSRTLLLVVVVAVVETLKRNQPAPELLRRAGVVVDVAQRAPAIDAATERTVEVDRILR